MLLPLTQVRDIFKNLERVSKASSLPTWDWAALELHSLATAKNGLQVRQPVLLGLPVQRRQDR